VVHQAHPVAVVLGGAVDAGGPVVVRVAGEHDAHAAVVGDHPGEDGGHVDDLLGGVERLGGRLEAGDGPQARDGGRHHRELAGLAAGDAVGGPQPLVGDDLAVVVQGGLVGRRGGQEEAGVVAAGGALGRDPVAEVVHAVAGEAQ